MKQTITLILTFVVFSTHAQMMLQADWESRDVYQDIFSRGSICTPHGAVISDSFARKGKYAVRFELRSSDTICGYSKRAELSLPAADSLQDIAWYAWSEYLPVDYAFDKHNELHFQLHHRSKYGPPLIGLWLTADRWKLVHTFDTVEISSRKPSIQQFDLGPVQKGTWTDWVLYTRFKLDTGGVIKLWRNGELLVDLSGPNFNREKGQPQKQPYLKFGLYKWPWKDYPGPFNPASRVVYFDEVKSGKEGMSIDDFIIKEENEQEHQ